jgi:predicted CXXCH cytochrome family protein
VPTDQQRDYLPVGRLRRFRLLASASSVAVAICSFPALAGIQGSKHDLSTNGAGQGASSSGTTEICVFCHTPHGADSSAAAPLWNKGLPVASKFSTTRYNTENSTTIDGSVVDVGSVSLVCLSCHDGSQAMDVMINAPGSGTNLDSEGELINAGVEKMTGIASLGSNLRNDHPVSIAYAGGACTGTTADCDPGGATTGDKDFAAIKYDQTPGGKEVWWVDIASYSLGGVAKSGNANTREKSDLILYPRNFSGDMGPSVECASCHDPHNEVTSSSESVAFLRIDNSGSALCLGCHIK